MIDHWGNQPHGIARVTQNLFLASLHYDDVNYFFYYCMKSDKFVVPRSVEYFREIATGAASFNLDDFPLSDDFQSQISAGDRVLITGAGWGLKNHLQSLREIKHVKNVKLACIIYDLIPVHSPQFFLEEFAALASGYQLEERVVQAEVRVSHAEERVVRAEERVYHAELLAHEAQMALTAVHGSSSWRLTAPLRKLATAGRIGGACVWMRLKTNNQNVDCRFECLCQSPSAVEAFGIGYIEH